MIVTTVSHSRVKRQSAMCWTKFSPSKVPPVLEDTGTSDRIIDDANLLDGVDFDDHDLFLGWLDGNIQHMSDSWLASVNFT